uniref:heparinase II/III domain-containing protein n=1 Tax=Persicitalea sp. TaxID=3100273 RepID=UPI003593280B
MEDYAPNGAYPEGYGYWNYGTTFNVLFLTALEKAFGTDYGLSNRPGFMDTAKYYENMIGTSGYPFNYSDAGGGDGKLSPAVFYFAKKSNDPSLLWIEKSYLQQADISRSADNRVFPLLMLLGAGVEFDKITPPSKKVWAGQGKSPVTLMRSSWTEPDAIFVGLKAGSPSAPHAHMDIGSFVMDADGVRWAIDLGSQNYHSLEKLGMDIWGKEQDAQRWTIKRYNNFIHNTLTVNDQLQRVNGYAKIDASGESDALKYGIANITDLYKGQLAAARRGIGIVDDSYVVVRDEVRASGNKATVRWVMLAPEGVKISNDNTAILSKDGKQLTLRVDSPANARLQTWSSAPTTDYDAPNEGTMLVGFEYEVPAGQSQVLQVSLLPQKVIGKVRDFKKPLDQWKP